MRLYMRDNANRIREWSIDVQGDEIVIDHGIVGMEQTRKIVTVEENKSGRDLYEQIELEVNSRISKMMDKGYIEDFEKAKNRKGINRSGWPKPMLAQVYDPAKVNQKMVIQYKYNGNRCLIAKVEGEVFAYSRNGKPISSIPHILSAAESLPDGTILDGELYKHGENLQTIRSWIARRQADSNNLEFVCYDIMSKEPLSKRLGALKRLGLGYPIALAPTIALADKEEVIGLLSEAISLGYEGLMGRMPDSPYEAGKRSKGLLKIKSWKDCEAIVESITASSEGGAILGCLYRGKPFNVFCHGNMEYKRYVLNNRSEYIGKKVTVQYSELTEGGIPFHPVAIAFRDESE